MPSIREIASLTGVSTSTVSRALNNDPAVNEATREMVLTAANRSGYVASIGRRITTNVGLVYVGGETLDSMYDSALLAGVVRGLYDARFDVVIVDLQRDKLADETYSQFFRRKGLRGAMLRTTATTRRICETIAREGFPAIALSERFEDAAVSYIDCDSRADSVRAIEYLVALGHRRIAFCMNNVPDRDHLDRLDGYKEALAEQGIPLDERLIMRQNANHAGGASAMKMLMSMPEPPTAAYFADPSPAVGATNTAHELGIRIPDDISVIGFDDGDVRHSVHPLMTAVCQDAGKLGVEAAVGLIRLIRDRSFGSVRVTLPTFFEVNQSTGPPPDVPVRALRERRPTTEGN